MPGIYEFGLTNASLVTGSRSCTYMFIGTGIAPLPLEIELTDGQSIRRLHLNSEDVDNDGRNIRDSDNHTTQHSGELDHGGLGSTQMHHPRSQQRSGRIPTRQTSLFPIRRETR